MKGNCVIVKFNGQPSQSGGKRKGYCSDMPNVVSATDGTSHEIQIPSMLNLKLCQQLKH
jgi:hypothetical protein